jgi:hypothetical protein
LGTEGIKREREIEAVSFNRIRRTFQTTITQSKLLAVFRHVELDESHPPTKLSERIRVALSEKIGDGGKAGKERRLQEKFALVIARERDGQKERIPKTPSESRSKKTRLPISDVFWQTSSSRSLLSLTPTSFPLSKKKVR